MNGLSEIERDYTLAETLLWFSCSNFFFRLFEEHRSTVEMANFERGSMKSLQTCVWIWGYEARQAAQLFGDPDQWDAQYKEPLAEEFDAKTYPALVRLMEGLVGDLSSLAGPRTDPDLARILFVSHMVYSALARHRDYWRTAGAQLSRVSSLHTKELAIESAIAFHRHTVLASLDTYMFELNKGKQVPMDEVQKYDLRAKSVLLLALPSVFARTEELLWAPIVTYRGLPPTTDLIEYLTRAE